MRSWQRETERQRDRERECAEGRSWEDKAQSRDLPPEEEWGWDGEEEEKGMEGAK